MMRAWMAYQKKTIKNLIDETGLSKEMLEKMAAGKRYGEPETRELVAKALGCEDADELDMIDPRTGDGELKLAAHRWQKRIMRRIERFLSSGEKDKFERAEHALTAIGAPDVDEDGNNRRALDGDGRSANR